MENRITELETKITFMENYIHELNQVIIEQEKRISNLELEAEKLKKQIIAFREALPEGERPPHY